MTRITAWGLTLALALALAVAGTAVGSDGTTTVILVRHAEKVRTETGDVPLSPEGEARARALVRVAERAGVDTAISSKFRRTRLTLAPAVAALGLPGERVLERTEAAEVAAEILENQRGRTVLVAGHSDTTPAIIEALGAPSLCPPYEVHEEHGCMIPDDEFHHLFVVTVPAEGAARLIWASYGAPSP